MFRKFRDMRIIGAVVGAALVVGASGGAASAKPPDKTDCTGGWIAFGTDPKLADYDKNEDGTLCYKEVEHNGATTYHIKDNRIV